MYSKPLDDDGGSSSTTVAQSGNTLLSWLQSVDERDDDSAAGSTDGLSVISAFMRL